MSFDKQHVMGAAVEASEPALVLTDQAPSGLDATRFDQAQGLIERLRSWPATDQGDALSAGFVGELMAQAADALSSRSDVLRKGAERIIFENCSHTVEGDRYFAISEAMVENAAKEIAALEASSRQEDEDTEFAENMATVREMQREWRNPIPQVALRAGFSICREYMARFIEQGGDTATAASVRANWLPELGEDYGPPRQLAFDELVDEDASGQWVSKDVSASLEGCCYAWVAMHQFGLLPPSCEGCCRCLRNCGRRISIARPVTTALPSAGPMGAG